MSQKEFESVKLSGWVYHKDKTLINVEDFIAEFIDWIEDKGFCFLGVGCGDESVDSDTDEEVEE